MSHSRVSRHRGCCIPIARPIARTAHPSPVGSSAQNDGARDRRYAWCTARRHAPTPIQYQNTSPSGGVTMPTKSPWTTRRRASVTPPTAMRVATAASANHPGAPNDARQPRAHLALAASASAPSGSSVRGTMASARGSGDCGEQRLITGTTGARIERRDVDSFEHAHDPPVCGRGGTQPPTSSM
jgi:hypothetical protein